jgi:hypothetical protein
MDSFNIPRKNGKLLAIPLEYYPRCADIIATKENLFCFTPISRLETLIQAMGYYIFNPVFAVLSVINLSLCIPILIHDGVNQEVIFYSYLFIGFITSYICTKLYYKLKNKDALSIDGVAERLGYKSPYSQLKPYDERMLKTIINLNDIKIRRDDLYFEDLYGIIFDVATQRRIADIYYASSRLRIIK